MDELGWADLVGLMGTQRSAAGGAAVQTYRVAGRQVIDAGYQRGKFSDRATGCMVMLGKRWKQNDSKGTWAAPLDIGGRGLAVRLRSGWADVKLIVVYFPPRPTLAVKRAAYLKTCENLADWIDSMLLACAGRTTPFMCVDCNDGMGRSPDGTWLDVQAVKEQSATKEALAGGAGELLRRTLDRHGLAAANAQGEKEATWYGAAGEPTMIDFVAAPAGLLAGEASCYPHKRIGGRLQLIAARSIRDHLPLLLTVRYRALQDDCEKAGEQGTRWDANALMLGPTKGVGRRGYVEKVEEAIQKDTRALEMAMWERTPDTVFEKINELVVKAGAEVYCAGESKGSSYKQDAEERLLILRRRREAREDLHSEENDVQEVEEALSRLTSRCRFLRCEQMKRCKEETANELWTAWDKRQLAEVVRLSRVLGGARFGPKKRDYRCIKLTLLRQEQWLEVWSKEGGQGGTEAEVIDHGEYVREHKECAPPLPSPTREMHAEVEEEVGRIRAYLKRAPQRRATPAGCPRLELVHMLMFPNCRMDHSKEGVGMEKDRLHNPLWFWRIKGALMHIRRSQLAPLAWHKSKAGVLRKSDMEGPKGRRVIHVLDVIGTSYYVNLVSKKGLFYPYPLQSMASHMDEGVRARSWCSSAHLTD